MIICISLTDVNPSSSGLFLLLTQNISAYWIFSMGYQKIEAANFSCRRSRLKFCFNIHWRMKMWRTQFDCMLMNEDQALPNLLKTKVAFWKVLKTENMKSPVKKTKTTPCAGSPNFDLVNIRPVTLIAKMFRVKCGHTFQFEFYPGNIINIINIITIIILYTRICWLAWPGFPSLHTCGCIAQFIRP